MCSSVAKWEWLEIFGCICMELRFRARVYWVARGYCVARKCQEVAKLVWWNKQRKMVGNIDLNVSVGNYFCDV